jgi:hypothetical protein
MDDSGTLSHSILPILRNLLLLEVLAVLSSDAYLHVGMLIVVWLKFATPSMR